MYDGLREIFDFGLITGKSPIFDIIKPMEIPQFGLWAIFNLAFMYAMLFRFRSIPAWTGVLATCATMLITSIIFDIHLLTGMLAAAIAGGMSYMVYSLRR